MDAEFHIDRISRGVFGVSGHLEVKQLMDDRSIVEVLFYRDKFCNKNYVIQPYSLRNMTFTATMNSYYKQLLMENLKECAENTPYFKEFVSPLEPVRAVFNKCQISTDNLPSYMSEGCYLVSINVHGQVEVKIALYSVVEKISQF